MARASLKSREFTISACSLRPALIAKNSCFPFIQSSCLIRAEIDETNFRLIAVRQTAKEDSHGSDEGSALATRRDSGNNRAEAESAHKDRAVLIHGLQQALSIRIPDWGHTDDKQPHEVVEIVIALAPIVIPVGAAVVKHWISSRQLEDVRIKVPNRNLDGWHAAPATLD